MQDYQNIGVTGLTAASAALLSDVVDNKQIAGVSTVGALQTLATAAQAVDVILRRR